MPPRTLGNRSFASLTACLFLVVAMTGCFGQTGVQTSGILVPTDDPEPVLKPKAVPIAVPITWNGTIEGYYGACTQNTGCVYTRVFSAENRDGEYRPEITGTLVNATLRMDWSAGAFYERMELSIGDSKTRTAVVGSSPLRLTANLENVLAEDLFIRAWSDSLTPGAAQTYAIAWQDFQLRGVIHAWNETEADPTG